MSNLQEIERKFLVNWDDIPTEIQESAHNLNIVQAYIPTTSNNVVRIRNEGGRKGRGYLAIKGENTGPTRFEAEYEIPASESLKIIEEVCTKPYLHKIRYIIIHDDMTWEVDYFLGYNRGLCVAEIELESEDQKFSKPDWVGEEVTGDPRYYNSNLVSKPFNAWKG